MKKKIAILAGDGIGPEIMAEAIKILDRIRNKYKIEFDYKMGLVGGAAWDKYKEHLPQDTLDICNNSDAILFGSVGGPVKDIGLEKWKGVEVNSLLGLRKHFGLYANLRPAKLYPSLSFASSLRKDISEKGFNLLVVRELTGGIYFGQPKGRVGYNDDEYAFDTLRYSRKEIVRIAKVAFETAKKRNNKVTSIDKANVLTTMVFWREIVDGIAKDYPEVEYESMFVDNAAMQLTRNPQQFDVVLCGNMFGDILSDEAAALTGSLGMLPSASIAESSFGMYEPSGGSAPDIAGLGVANPIAQILSAAMMLRYSFGLNDAADDMENAVEKTLEDKYCTADIWHEGCKKVSTEEMGNKIVSYI